MAPPDGEGLYLVVGLGNPGEEYAGTRHNVGFMVLDRLLLGSDASFKREKRWYSKVAKMADGPVVYMKPQTFMNVSGKAVAAALRYQKLSPANLLIVYDDVDLPFGRLRFREQGSAGGHNGIRSIISLTGTDMFPRLKVGVGRETAGSKGLAEHVLEKFAPEEAGALENCLDHAVDAVTYALAHGVRVAMGRFNQKPSPG